MPSRALDLLWNIRHALSYTKENNYFYQFAIAACRLPFTTCKGPDTIRRMGKDDLLPKMVFFSGKYQAR